MTEELVNKLLAKLPNGTDPILAREIIDALGIKEACVTIENPGEYSDDAFIDYTKEQLKRRAADWIVRNVDFEMKSRRSNEFTTEYSLRFLCVTK